MCCHSDDRFYILYSYGTGPGIGIWVLFILQGHHLNVYASHITTQLFFQQIVWANNKESIKALHYWPLFEENPPVTSGFPSQRASNGDKEFPCHDDDGSISMRNVLWLFYITVEQNRKQLCYVSFVFTLHVNEFSIKMVLFCLTLLNRFLPGHCGGGPQIAFHGANLGHSWVLSAPGGSHVGPMSLAIRGLSMRFSQGWKDPPQRVSSGWSNSWHSNIGPPYQQDEQIPTLEKLQSCTKSSIWPYLNC